jgi:hypothetical protein
MGQQRVVKYGIGALLVAAFFFPSSALCEEEQEAVPVAVKKNPRRAGIYFAYEKSISDDLFPSQFSFGVDWTRGGKGLRYHFLGGIRRRGDNFRTAGSTRPLTWGYAIPVLEQKGLSLDVEILAHLLELELPMVSTGGGYMTVSSGVGVQVVGKLGKKFFFAVSPGSLMVRYYTLTGGGGQSTGYQYAGTLMAGLEF